MRLFHETTGRTLMKLLFLLQTFIANIMQGRLELFCDFLVMYQGYVSCLASWAININKEKVNVIENVFGLLKLNFVKRSNDVSDE